MSASDAETRIDRAFARRWNSIPLFWKFQCLGWLAFLIASFPLKLVVLESWEAAFVVSVYREGMGFITTWGMREVYRRIYRESMGWTGITGLIGIVSAIGATVQASLVLAFHDFFDFEEEKLFKGDAVFAVVYFRASICLAWSLLYFGIKFWREKTNRELRLALIESEKKDAQLQMLRAQMNPHFLFNALTSIRAGIGKPDVDSKGAVEALADFLRFSLEHRKEDLVPLGKEFEAMKSYLAVEKARFREDLEIQCRIDENAATALVPGVFLQPLVENAIKYGWKYSHRPLRVSVVIAQSSSNSVDVEVANTGEWIGPEPGRKVGGLGLANLRTRLQLLYPQSHTFETHAGDGWVTIRITIPFDRESAGT